MSNTTVRRDRPGSAKSEDGRMEELPCDRKFYAGSVASKCEGCNSKLAIVHELLEQIHDLVQEMHDCSNISNEDNGGAAEAAKSCSASSQNGLQRSTTMHHGPLARLPGAKDYQGLTREMTMQRINPNFAQPNTHQTNQD